MDTGGICVKMGSAQLMLTALRFNEKINERDVQALAELMTEDHVFVDSEGNLTKGREAMREGWKSFFESYPDYRNTFTCVTIQDGIVVMVGHSSCSYKPLDGPNVWTAKIRDGRVSEWRVMWLDKR